MRVFWAVLGVLMLAAAGYLLASGVDAGPGPAPPTPPQRPDTISKPVEPAPPTPAPMPKEQPAATVATDAPPDKPRAAPTEPPKPFSDPPPIPAGNETTKPPDTKPPAPPVPAATPDPAPAEPVADKPKPPEETPAAGAAAPSIVRNEDGSITVDGKWTIKGEGTPASPYQISWDQLVSVQEDYAPKEGRESIPPHVKMLDQKHVQITGNVTFPIMMDEPDECLVMLNQWDGCCIGIPPTPYDAIEVRLKEPVTGNARMTTYGTLKGRLRVEPHLVGGWLVGLYLMDQASLTPQAYGGFAP